MKFPLQVAGLCALALLGRLITFGAPFVDIDAMAYLGMAEDFRQALAEGTLGSRPWTHENYHAIEYWPFLYSFAAGAVATVLPSVLSAAVAVSMAAGSLLVVPVVLLGRELWGPRTGLLAGLLVALHPALVRYSQIPRTEGLYILLYLAAALFTWKGLQGSRPAAAAAGAAWAGCCMTRFDGLMGALLGLFALGRAGLRRSRPALAAVTLLAFAAVGGPYYAYLGRLAGRPAVLPPQKEAYDSLEMLWVVEGGVARMDEFLYRFGPPGDVREEEVRQALAGRAGEHWDRFRRSYLRSLPGSVGAFLQNLSPLEVALLLLAALAGRRDPGVGFLAWLGLPVLAYTGLTFWDPHARYYGFSVPLALLVIARGLTTGRSFRALAEPETMGILFALSWKMPPPFHRDDHILNFGSWPAVETAQALGAIVPPFLAAVALTALVLCRRLLRRPRLAGGAALLLGGGGLAVIARALARRGLELPESVAGLLFFSEASPWRYALAGLAAVAALCHMGSGERSRGPSRVVSLAGLALALLWAPQGVWLRSEAVYRHRLHVGHGLTLPALPPGSEGPWRLMSEDPQDAVWLGAEWVPMVPAPRLSRLEEELARRRADFLLVDGLEIAGPVPPGRYRQAEAAERRGVLERVEERRWRPGPGAPRQWARLYRVRAPTP